MRFFREHPEWWAMALSAAAWIPILASGPAPGPAHAHHAHGGASSSTWSAMFHWTAMVAAMMFPLLIGHVRAVAVRSFWPRRHRSIALFLAGYTALWLPFGLALAAAIGRWPGAPWIAATVLAAAAWQFTPWKRAALLACHRTIPLAPDGLRADLDCLRYGWTIARTCFASCWAMMAVCAAAHGWIAAMPLLTILMWTEKFGLRRAAALLTLR